MVEEIRQCIADMPQRCAEELLEGTNGKLGLVVV
jgi:hypothetical protein